MDKFLDMLYIWAIQYQRKVKVDGAAHQLACLILTLLEWGVVQHFVHWAWALLVAVVMTVILGICKELLDKYTKRGTYDVRDLVNDGWGLLVAVVLIIIIAI